MLILFFLFLSPSANCITRSVSYTNRAQWRCRALEQTLLKYVVVVVFLLYCNAKSVLYFGVVAANGTSEKNQRGREENVCQNTFAMHSTLIN